MGKFDKKLEGDKKLHGVKCKFNPTEMSAEKEKETSLSVLSQLDGDAKRARIERNTGDGVLNVCKAICAVSKGKGGVALGKESLRGSSKGSLKNKRGKR